MAAIVYDASLQQCLEQGGVVYIVIILFAK